MSAWNFWLLSYLLQCIYHLKCLARLENRTTSDWFAACLYTWLYACISSLTADDIHTYLFLSACCIPSHTHTHKYADAYVHACTADEQKPRFRIFDVKLSFSWFLNDLHRHSTKYSSCLAKPTANWLVTWWHQLR